MKSLILALVVSITILTSCTPKKDYKDKMIDLAVNDLHQKVKVPSSFMVDSVNVTMVEEHIFDKYIGKYMVDIHFQSQNAFGALLKGEALYYIDRDKKTGNLSIYEDYIK